MRCDNRNEFNSSAELPSSRTGTVKNLKGMTIQIRVFVIERVRFSKSRAPLSLRYGGCGLRPAPPNFASNSLALLGRFTQCKCVAFLNTEKSTTTTAGTLEGFWAQWTSGHTKAQAAAAARRVEPATERRLTVPGGVDPAAPAVHPGGALTIPAPLLNVAVHVKQSPGIARLGTCWVSA